MANESFIVGTKVKQYRKIHNMTQEALAEKLGVQTDHITAVESGKRGLSFKRILLFCQMFNVELSEMIPIDKLNSDKLKEQLLDELYEMMTKLDAESLGFLKLVVNGLLGN